MRSKLVLLGAVATVLFTRNAAAAAKPIFTSPLHVFLASNVECAALNGGTRPAKVHVEIVFAGDGTTILSSADAAALAPGQTVQTSINGFPAGELIFCRATGLSRTTGRLTFVDFTNSLVVTVP